MLSLPAWHQIWITPVCSVWSVSNNPGLRPSSLNWLVGVGSWLWDLFFFCLFLVCQPLCSFFCFAHSNFYFVECFFCLCVVSQCCKIQKIIYFELFLRSSDGSLLLVVFYHLFLKPSVLCWVHKTNINKHQKGEASVSNSPSKGVLNWQGTTNHDTAKKKQQLPKPGAPSQW